MKQRVITGIVAAGIFLPLLIIGGLPFTIFTYFLATVAIFELLRMKNISIFSMPGLISVLLLWIFLLPSKYLYMLDDLNITKIELSLLAVFIFLSYTVLTKNKFTIDDVGFVILATLYIGLSCFYLIEIRGSELIGLKYIFFVLIVVWSTDSGAYFIGKAIGKKKLWPDISPNKTIEGSLGGILSAIIIGLIYYWLVPLTALSLPKVIILTIILSIVGQIGDLVESALKRHFHVKDPSRLLSGHGGVLDRVDSWLFAIPILHFILLIM